MLCPQLSRYDMTARRRPLSLLLFVPLTSHSLIVSHTLDHPRQQQQTPIEHHSHATHARFRAPRPSIAFHAVDRRGVTSRQQQRWIRRATTVHWRRMLFAGRSSCSESPLRRLLVSSFAHKWSSLAARPVPTPRVNRTHRKRVRAGSSLLPHRPI